MGFALPFGILQAVTNPSFSPVVLAEILFGYMLPGRPLARMIFKTAAGGVGSQAILYSGDQKFERYMKIPPRVLFSAQVIASIIEIISSLAAQKWAMDNIPDICSPHQKDSFTCPNINLFNTGSIIASVLSFIVLTIANRMSAILSFPLLPTGHHRAGLEYR